MKIINLLPTKEQKELHLEILGSQTLSFWIWVVATMLAILAAGLLSTGYLSQRISINNNDIEEKKQSLSSASIKQLEQEVLALNQQTRLIDNLRHDHYQWSEVLIELDKLVDADTTITSLQMERDTGKIILYGNSLDRENMLAFWSSVKKSKYFKEINFPLTNLERDIDADFSFTFYVKPEEIKLK